jgi:hypothetical protein
VDGWVDGWMDGWESRVKDCLQQSKKVLCARADSVYFLLWDMQLHRRLLKLQMDEKKDFFYNAMNIHGYTTFFLWKGMENPACE